MHVVRIDDSINVKGVFERKANKLVKCARNGFVMKVYAKKPQNYEGDDIEITWDGVRINAYMNSNERERYLDAGFPDYKDPSSVEFMDFGKQLLVTNKIRQKVNEI